MKKPSIKFTERNLNRITAFLVFLISFIIYMLTVAPTIFFGDSGEFVTAAYHLGIVHPPGYPLYLLLGKLFMSIFPFGDMAYRMNVLSGLFASLTVVFVFLSAHHVFKKRWIAASLSILGAFSATFWSQAVVTEVYTLSALFFMILVYLVLLWMDSGEKKYLLWTAFIGGLALTHHITIAAFYPVLVVFILIKNWKIILNWKLVIKIIVLMLLPLLLYLYLPIRSAADPPTDWGNPETFQSMITHISAQQYKGKLLEFGMEGVIFQLKKFAHITVDNWSIIHVLLFIAGFILMFIRKRLLAIFFFLIILVNVAYSSIYFIVDIENYFIPAFFIMLFFVGELFQFFSEWYKEKKPIYRYVLICLLVFVVLLPIGLNWRESDRSGNYLARLYGLDLYKTMDKDAICFTHGDNESFIMAYLSLVEKIRPDVDVYDRTQNILPYPMPRSQDKGGVVTAPIADQYEREIVFHGDRPAYFNFFAKNDYPLVQTGLLYRVARVGTDYKDYSYIWKEYAWSQVEDESNYDDFMSCFVAARYFEARAKSKWNSGDIKGADEDFERSLEVAGDNDPMIVNIGIFYINHNKQDKGEKLLHRALKINPFSGDSYNGLGTIAFNKGEFDKALDYYNKSAELVKENESVFMNRALTYENLADKEKDKDKKEHLLQLAFDDLNTVSILNPHDPNLEANYFRLYEKQEDEQQVIKRYEEKLASEPDNQEFRYSFGVFLAKKNLYKRAIIQFNHVLRINEYHIPSLLDMGGAYLKLRQEEKAIEKFYRVLELDPQNEKARKGINMIEDAVRRGKLKMDLNKYKKRSN